MIQYVSYEKVYFAVTTEVFYKTEFATPTKVVKLFEMCFTNLIPPH